MFIALEGPDFVGKTTVANALTDPLKRLFSAVWNLRFPSDTPAGKVARAMLKNKTTDPDYAIKLQSCMMADQLSMQKDIYEFSKSGGVIVADRWHVSGLIYGIADGIDQDWLINAHVSFLQPILHILLDASIEVLEKRAKVRGSIKDRFENFETLKAVAESYRAFWSKGILHLKDGDSHLVVINADQSVEAIVSDILKYVNLVITGIL